MTAREWHEASAPMRLDETKHIQVTFNSFGQAVGFTTTPESRAKFAQKLDDQIARDVMAQIQRTGDETV